MQPGSVQLEDLGACAAAGRDTGRAEDEGGAGMHQLRHHFASLLLRGRVDIKRVQEWLGHHSAAFTLDIYGHLMPKHHEASLRQVEAIFATALRSAPDGPMTARPGEEGR